MSSTPSRRSVFLVGTAAALGAPLPAASGASAAAPADSPSHRRVMTGADVAAASGWRMLRGRKVGVVSNQTGVLEDTSHIVDSMTARKDLNVVGVFGPEHGFRGTTPAGEAEPEYVDPRTGLPVYSIYAADAAEMAQMFRRAGTDTIVYDIQDVGVRFYEFIWAMYQAMVAARDIGAAFLVLDRPNPIGRRADGPMMTKEYTSAVGLKPILQQYGLTAGELAGYFNGELLPDEGKGGQVDLDVVRVRGWNPWEHAQETGLMWVPPSPNMPTPDTATVYPGTCYFEGTNLSEGRGTTRPFEFIGAPWLDYRYSDRLNARGLPGVRFREAYFVPAFSKHEGKTCAGVQLHVTDLRRYRPIATAVAMLAEAMKYDEFAWRKDDDPRPYWIDKLSGSTRLRKMLDAGKDTGEITAAWQDEVRAFDRTRRAYFLYR
ncbi:exo-beta-N-acetylmuramidase NamZ family protein [Streptomyces shenzhenensis]|uniref:exo-beta-N-acetylmuramidase NamZ family protein n=1 Tax=Streptomyces shenzhenensis TaxID=943815 RepID=UPI0015F063A0|nr:DUF1343 domain-containing protein [Streptomyces shenzhenensis]